ncbi:tetraacyldisaccharide 4'-kinase [Mesorhizobium sp. IMUNJ 23232]|uniref:tetraacyldisaccharide 4'-kinase n=1 Tax=Mesorhizobium sp. IMUNJ 23232 TaxID=3376064 RepID=UPI0037A2DDC5
MSLDAPRFWWRPPGWQAWALSPVSAIYGAVARRRLVTAPREPVDLPVLCVGNFTVGGSGKTPVAIALAKQAAEMGRKPGFLSRGHGGSSSAPRIVDPAADSARDVGDEPLLLAAHAPVAVSPDRAAAARMLAAQGCDFLIMDDGFQSARILFDYALLVVDARHGIGNGKVLPAGPLRAHVADQLHYADAVLRMGEGTAADPVLQAAPGAGKPVFGAVLRPRNPARFAGRRMLAFAGIGHPDKFFETLRQAGAEVAVAQPFPDHHFYAADELQSLADTAQGQNLGMVTTAKDAARLSGMGLPAEILGMVEVLEIDAVFEDDRTAERIVRDALAAWKKRWPT